jgi:M6 family metalloprotease-like protein
MRVSVLYALAAGMILAVGAAIAPPDLDAQDVEMRGRIHGKELPPGMRDVLARDPTAYQFKRVWKEYARTVRERRQELARAGDFGTLNSHLRGISASVAAAQASGAALADTFRFPVLTGIFLDSTHVFLPDSITLSTVLFGSAVGPPYSISTYYEEASSELLAVTGDVINWVTVDSAASWYEGPNNGGDPATDHTGDFIKALLDSADASVDFSVYDGDGDTFVDLIAVLHPLQDGSCTPSTHIWAHSWSYSAWMGSPYLTDDGVLIDDYIIQSAVGGINCNVGVPMAVGTMVHEMGHGMLGLPDLYDTGAGEADPTSKGIGWWGLMGAGNWNRQDSPAHMSAWSKDMVGWISIQTIAEGSPPGDYLLWPIVDSLTAIRIDLAGTNEYFLLENRHRLGSDAFLAGEGLLIWHVDPEVITQWWPWNEVNAHDPHGLTLEQADGDDDLGNNVNRGDSGDPFPGLSVNTDFGPGTTPNSNLNDGTISGIRVDSITRNLPDLSIAFRVAVNLTQKRITTNWPGTEVIVDGMNEDSPHDVIWGFPTMHTISVDTIQGDTLTRFAFQSWSDGGARSHSIAVSDVPPDTYTANLQAEFRLRAVTDLTGSVNSSVILDGNGTAWLLPGSPAQLEAVPFPRST